MGYYIILEGIVGTGKSTQAQKLFTYLKDKKKDVILTREPGGTDIAESIRKLVQGTNFQEHMDPVCEAYLYASARAQLLRKTIKPVLDRGGIVISDRSFISSLAYQGEARGLGINKVMEINKVAVQGFMPDIVIFFQLDEETGLKRTFDKEGDKFEKLDSDFFKRVQLGYKKVSQMPQFTRVWKNIDASGDIEIVFNRIINLVEPNI